MRTPDVQADFYLVEIGYQMDVFFVDENGKKLRCSICRDFGGDYPISTTKEKLVDALAECLQNLERNHLKGKKNEK